MNILIKVIGVLAHGLPDGKNPTPPSGDIAEKANDLVNQVVWGVLISCILAFVVSVGVLAWAAVTGRALSRAGTLIVIIIAAILVGSAAGIIKSAM